MNQPAKTKEKKPRRPPGIPLTKVGHVRDELAKVYREARRGDLGTNRRRIEALRARLQER